MQRIDKKSNNTIEQTSYWNYHDNSSNNGFGQLKSEYDSNGYAITPTYDVLGRVVATTTKLPGLAQPYTSKQNFDNMGRLYQSFDAASGRDSNGYRGLQYVYNQYGYLKQTEDVRRNGNKTRQVYNQVLQMTARGQISQYRLGNGVVTTLDIDRKTGNINQVQGRSFNALKRVATKI